MTDVIVVADPDALAEAAAAQFVEAATQMLARQARWAVALSGGATPRAAYKRLAAPDLAGQVDWARVHFFWGDERCVPPDHPESDYGMARAALLDHIPAPAANIHRMRGELDPAEAAAAYQAELERYFEPARPRFDLVWLGLGEDGHTASLFPGTAALHEAERWVAANRVEALHTWRLTLTPPVINHAAQVTFLVSGSRKTQILQAVLHGPYQPEVRPAQLVQPASGRLIWLVDRAAASQL
jgi:6-phosphogluconolactonase